MCGADIVVGMRPASDEGNHVIEMCLGSLNWLQTQIADAIVSLEDIVVRHLVRLCAEPSHRLLAPAFFLHSFPISFRPPLLLAFRCGAAVRCLASMTLPFRCVSPCSFTFRVQSVVTFAARSNGHSVRLVVLPCLLILVGFVRGVPLALVAFAAFATPYLEAVGSSRLAVKFAQWLRLTAGGATFLHNGPIYRGPLTAEVT